MNTHFNSPVNSFREWRDYDQPITAPELYFYHTTELPEPIGLVNGHWDLRGSEDVYLGNVDLRNKSVFDCGVASGYMAFEMEKRGARVIGLDLDETCCDTMGLIPFHDFEKRFGLSFERAVANRKKSQRYLRNSFLYTRNLKNSSVPLYIGDIMRDKIIVPRVDVALFGCILLHLNDPLSAIYNVAQHVQEAIITETIEGRSTSFDDVPALLFRPDVRLGENPGSWHYPHPAWLKKTLEIVGFSKFELHKGFVKDMHNNVVEIFSLVARRANWSAA